MCVDFIYRIMPSANRKFTFSFLIFPFDSFYYLSIINLHTSTNIRLIKITKRIQMKIFKRIILIPFFLFFVKKRSLQSCKLLDKLGDYMSPKIPWIRISTASSSELIIVDHPFCFQCFYTVCIVFQLRHKCITLIPQYC